MRLNLKNIGKLSKADIEINGITVIAGENNTGKSTVGKVLYSIFNSFYHLSTQIEKEKERLFRNEIENRFNEINNPYSFNASSLIRELRMSKNISNKRIAELIQDNIWRDFVWSVDEESNLNNSDTNVIISDEYLSFVQSCWQKYNEISPLLIYITMFNTKIRNEFSAQICNIYSQGQSSNIGLDVHGERVNITIQDNKVEKIDKTLSLNKEIIYIDDPFVIDNMLSGRQRFIVSNIAYRQSLTNKLTSSKNNNEVEEAFREIIINDKLNLILEKLNSICNGTLSVKGRREFVYKLSDNNEELSLKNISTGLKTFIIIKTLLLNGWLEEQGTIILDEPEIHLHLEWQIVFAEIIVLLQKEFNMHILLNTHSPYFLEAIEVYSKKHNIEGKCKYYLAENIGSSASIVDVTEDIELVYKKLAKPFQKLENERYGDD